MSKFNVSLENFTGPLDLLLHLISKSKIDIKDIFLSEITDQYISIVYSSENIDMESMGEFLAMAARLLEIKSKALLPTEDVDSDLEEDKQLLIMQIEEYRKIKSIIPALEQLESKSSLFYTKLPEEAVVIEPIVELKENTVSSLSNAIFRLLERKLLQEEKKRYKGKINSLRVEQITIKQSILNILKNLSSSPVLFNTFINKNDPEYYATYFIALLELIKRGRVSAKQKNTFDSIYVKKESTIWTKE